MREFEKLELSVETIRELTDDQLSQVAGAAATSFCLATTEFIPSNGGMWTMMCRDTTDIIQTG